MEQQQQQSTTISGTMDMGNTNAVEKLTQKLFNLSITSGTTKQAKNRNKPEPVGQLLVVVTKQTLFYNQHAKIYPIFMPQPVRPAKILIHVVRHAQASHNVSIKPGTRRPRVIDPELTSLGIKQAIRLGKTFHSMNNITHILCSPLKRTLHTTQLAFEPLISQGLKIVAYPDIREQGKGASSTGTSLEELLKLHPKENRTVDLTLVPEGWEINTEDADQQKHGIRAKRVRKELWKLATEALKEEGGVWKGHGVSRGSTHKNIEILIVSHGAFLKKMCEQDNMLWNCQYRTYAFDHAAAETWKLQETLESINRKFVPMWK